MVFRRWTTVSAASSRAISRIVVLAILQTIALPTELPRREPHFRRSGRWSRANNGVAHHLRDQANCLAVHAHARRNHWSPRYLGEAKPLVGPDHASSHPPIGPAFFAISRTRRLMRTRADHSVATCAHKAPTWQMTRNVPTGNPRCARHAPCASSCALNCSAPAGPMTSSCTVASAGPPVTTTTR